MSSNPTRETYAELEKAYDFFNQALFEGRLHSCLITLQRQHDTFGYFSANQFVSRDAKSAHEIALNPSYFAIRPIPETLSVLVREMVTLDQVLHSKNKLPRRRYRNREWADMCEAIGLMPSDTGLPGGKRVGDNVQTYIIAGGPFDNACTQLVDEKFTLSWLDRFPPKILAPMGPIGGDAEALATFDADDSDGDAEPARAAFSLPVSEPLSPDLVAETAGVAVDDGQAYEMPEHEPSNAPAASATGTEPEHADTSGAPAMRHFNPVSEVDLQAIGVEPREPPQNTSKTRFQCPMCNAKAWGKPSLRIHCLGSDEAPHDGEMMIAGQSGARHE